MQEALQVPSIKENPPPGQKEYNGYPHPEPTRPQGAVRYSEVNVIGLMQELEANVQGEVRFDAGSRALYATDGSNYRQVPIGVVLPKCIKDVEATVAAARRYGAPILSRGGGTSLAGQTCNVAVLMDFTKYMHGVLEIDAAKKLGRVQPGCVLDDLRKAAEKHQITFGPDPATHNRCTLGGMCGNDSCGSHSLLAENAGLGARTADNIEELEILLYDGTRMRVGKTSEEELEEIIKSGGQRGQIYAALKNLRDKYADEIRNRFPKIPRRVSGYNLDSLLPENGFNVAAALVGTESTCVTILEIVTKLVSNPKTRSLVVLGYPEVFQAADHVMDILAHKPIGLEGLDKRFIADLRKKDLELADISLFPEGNGYLLVEFGGDSKEESDAAARAMMEDLKTKGDAPNMKMFDKKSDEEHIWGVRESGLGATAHIPGMKENWEGWEDSAVAPEKMGKYLRDVYKLLDKYDYYSCMYGHFGDGCLHMRIDFDLKTTPGIETFRKFIKEAAELVVNYGGSLSGEHGDGQSKAEFLPMMFGDKLMEAFSEFKAIWDPTSKMNPGKIIRPYRIDENLRYGADYHPPQLLTHFKFPQQENSFSKATELCVGVGECRREEGGTMCPSYMVTREEKDSTRGRARLLFEMLQGEVLKDGWKNEDVKDALDLCLACKGCKGDCPVNVDMATYKSEFLSHYYEGRARPRYAYVFGLIGWMTRQLFRVPLLPRLANFMTQTPGISNIFKKIAGVAPQRRMPAFAAESFIHWFNRREPKNQDKPPVILWPDTFNTYFHPTTAQSAVEVLEAAGFQVQVPQQLMCCGRPLYDYGFLDIAESWLKNILKTMSSQIEAGLPFIVLEPSCAAVFREELTNLFPTDLDAKRLCSQTYLLDEFLNKKVPDFKPPHLDREVLVHGHCHHKAIMKMSDEEAMLGKMGIEYHEADSGCCGMAGAFGFEEGEHYDVAIKCGERVLLPEVRKASREDLIVADGFSCREQITQTTDRQALHPAQVLQMALRGDDEKREYPENKYMPTAPTEIDWGAGAIIGGIGVAAAGALCWVIKKYW
jgi:FAD/FMN-containing dehydrogenase/Fe-S oxidoreductase